MKTIVRSGRWLGWCLLLSLLSGCSLTGVSNYDKSTVDDVTRISRDVDLFYFELQDTPLSERQYAAFQSRYNQIYVDLRALQLRQSARANNALTLEQVQIAIKLWEGDRAMHKEKNSFPNVLIKLHQSQFQRVFTAIMTGEQAKEL